MPTKSENVIYGRVFKFAFAPYREGHLTRCPTTVIFTLASPTLIIEE